MNAALQQSQIDAAGRLHARLEQWRVADRALATLNAALPGFDEESCVLKVVAINSLYATQIYAVIRMAQHVSRVCESETSDSSACELVDAIAAIPARKGEKPRRHVSFASKFCHFFIDHERHPIYDEAARVALKLHIGAAGGHAQASPYGVFLDGVARLRGAGGFTCSARALDRYLWIIGMYVKWTKERRKETPRVNRELSSLFESADRSVRTDLVAALPAQLRVG